ncbi:MAG: TIR domain-containing protein [bacterium]|nr:TIR domain-containing protein [bacterium]
MITETIISLITSGAVSKAIDALLDYFEKYRSTKSAKEEVIVLKSRLNQIERNERLGVVGQKEILIERNRITNTLLVLLDEIQATEENSSESDEGLNVFISYSHKDKTFRDELDIHLMPLKRQKTIEVWYDSEIVPGLEWEEEIKRNLENSDIILQLVSPDFIASEYCYSDEMYEALEKHQKGDLRVIPILIKECDWRNTPFANLQFLPKDAKPISKFKNKDEAYLNVVSHIKSIVDHRFQASKDTRNQINILEKQLENASEATNEIEILEALVDCYSRINKQDKVKELTEKRNKLKFYFNVKNPIIIDELLIEGVSIFDEIRWDLQPNINLLLGRNGYGKTHLLRLIPCLLRNEKKIMDIDYKLYNYSVLKLSVHQNEEIKLTHYNECQFIETIGIVPMLAIPAIRNIHPTRAISPIKDELSGELCEIGASYFIQEYPFDKLLQDKLFVFGNDILKFSRRKKSIESAINDSPLVKLITDTIGELTNNTFEIKNVKEYFGQSSIDIEVSTEGNNEPILLQKVSQGTLSVISIIILIYYYLKSLYPEIKEKKLLSQKGIVLIDEVDAHLHPIWQQKIVGILRNSFPNIQFLLTAHSPLVVSGCLEREVAVLNKRKGAHKFTLTQFENNFIGKEIQEIYDEVFEIEDVDNDETYLSYLTKLSTKKEASIEKRINQLASKSALSSKQNSELLELYRLIQVSEIREKKENGEKEETENLKAEIRRLKRRLDENEPK